MRTPPLLVSFSDKKAFFAALSQETRTSHEVEINELLEKNLPSAVSARCLATLFGYSPKFVGSLLHKTERYYRTFVIPKGTKKRTIHAPKIGLKVIQKWLGEHLSNAIPLSPNAHGFIKNRSHITAAKVHLGAKWIYSVDIRNFFPTTPMNLIRIELEKIGYKEYAAYFIAKLCSYDGFLAQGSPASPFLSNLVFRDLDEKIAALAERLGAKYTRYADDLVFSGINDFPEELKTVKTIIEESGWKIAENKERYSQSPNRLKVHGLLVHGNEIRLTKGYRNKIRIFKHLINTKRDEIQNLSVIEGHLSYSDSIDKAANE